MKTNNRKPDRSPFLLLCDIFSSQCIVVVTANNNNVLQQTTTIPGRTSSHLSRPASRPHHSLTHSRTLASSSPPFISTSAAPPERMKWILQMRAKRGLAPPRLSCMHSVLPCLLSSSSSANSIFPNCMHACTGPPPKRVGAWHAARGTRLCRTYIASPRGESSDCPRQPMYGNGVNATTTMAGGSVLLQCSHGNSRSLAWKGKRCRELGPQAALQRWDGASFLLVRCLRWCR